MRNDVSETESLDVRIAERLKALRQERGWSLEELAGRCGVSRATLSRLENGEVSPTASVLGRLCPAYSLTVSRLMAMAETDFAPLVARGAQPVWRDSATGFTRRSVSPPADTLAAEVLECALEPGAHVEYESPPKPGLEHHILLLEGRLDMTIEGRAYGLGPGDCLRYRLFGASAFRCVGETPARYVLVVV